MRTYDPTSVGYHDQRARERGIELSSDYFDRQTTVLEASAVNATDTLGDHLARSNPYWSGTMLGDKLAAEHKAKTRGSRRVVNVERKHIRHAPLDSSGDSLIPRTSYLPDVPVSTAEKLDRLLNQGGLRATKRNPGQSADLIAEVAELRAKLARLTATYQQSPTPPQAATKNPNKLKSPIKAKKPRAQAFTAGSARYLDI